MFAENCRIPMIHYVRYRHFHFLSLCCRKLGSSEEIIFRDTFQDSSHIRESFAHANVEFESTSSGSELLPPYSLSFDRSSEKENILVKHVDIPTKLFSQSNPKESNSIRFSASQIEAIRSGFNKVLNNTNNYTVHAKRL